MKIGIIGAGAIGTAFATALARAGISAIIANSRGPDSLASLVENIGGALRAGSLAEAAAQNYVFVAVPWSRLPDALEDLPDFEGRILIDANNPIEAPLFQPIDLGDRISSTVVADMVVGARVIKAFNHLPPSLLANEPRGTDGSRRVAFVAGDDALARGEVVMLADRLGFAAIDLGVLAQGGRLTQFPGGPLAAQHLVKLP